MKQNELLKLRDMLNEALIPHNVVTSADGFTRIQYPACIFFQFVVAMACGDVDDIVAGGQLKFSGLLTDEDKSGEITNINDHPSLQEHFKDPFVFMSAEDCFERIKNHWDANKEEICAHNGSARSWTPRPVSE